MNFIFFGNEIKKETGEMEIIVKENIDEYKKKLRRIASVMRKDILTMISRAGSGHPGGSFSCVEILVVLYFYQLRYNVHEDIPNINKNKKEEIAHPVDMFILSKGHAAPALYSALSLAGLISRSSLVEFRTPSSFLQGHPTSFCAGVEMTSGPLGQGLSFGVGCALDQKKEKKGEKTYVLLGDGELQGGQIWEAAMSAAHFELANLCAIIDRNDLQLDGPTAQIKNIFPIADKFAAFGWGVKEIDGHNFSEIIDAFDIFFNENKKKPLCIIARTIKGKGIKKMEDKIESHGMKIDREFLKECLEELTQNEEINYE